MESIAALCAKHRTDKQCSQHNYAPFYDQFFGHRRGEPLRLLEIGVASGASLRVWREAFPSAEIVGLDINPDARRVEGTFFVRGDQLDPVALANCEEAAGGPFDIVIDDGGHDDRLQIGTFNHLFLRMAPGGIYVVEDLCCSYYNGRRETSAVGRFKELVDDAMSRGKLYYGDKRNASTPERAEKLAKLMPLERHVHSLFFANSIMFVFKS